MNNDKKKELSLHFILSAVFLNGYLQGARREALNDSVLKIAEEEIKKLYDKK